MAITLPAKPTLSMIAAGAAQLAMAELSAGAARRWAILVYSAMLDAHLGDSGAKVPKAIKQFRAGYSWPIEFVHAWISEAADTDRRMPIDKSMRAPGMASWWPEVVRSRHEAYGADKPRNTTPAPSPLEIQRLYAIDEWLGWLTNEARALVWAKAHRYTWPRLAKQTGKSERALRYMHSEAIEAISLRLSATKARKFPFMTDPRN